MMSLFLILLIQFYLLITYSQELQSTKILFGSCSKPYFPQPLWPMILSRNPDVWIWGGDIVYHDRPNISCFIALYDYLNPFNSLVNTFHCHRMGFGAMKPEIYDYNYELQLENKEYQQLLTNNKTKIIGIWDDHDYGQNDGDFTNKYKQQAKEALMKFLNISQNDPIRNRNGIYSFHTFTFNNQLIIDIYLLDNRWFSDRKSNILLGDEQWFWLNNTIQKRTLLLQNIKNMNSISLFVSGIPMLPYYRIGEIWATKSNIDRIKLMELILNKNVINPIIISGDVHYSEFIRYNCKLKTEQGIYKSLYEFTSSGMTHSWSYTYPKMFLFFKQLAMRYHGDGATIGMNDDLNFGEIDTIYDNENIKHIFLRIYGVKNVSLEIDLMEDKYKNIDEMEIKVIENHMSDIRHNMENQDWICVGYNEPNQWISRLYFMFQIFLAFVAVLIFFGTIFFAISCGCCCCCGKCCGNCYGCKRKLKTL